MRLIILIFAIFLVSSDAHAEIYNCDGVFRNLPCDNQSGASQSKVADQNVRQQDLERKNLARKKSLVHDLTMKAIDANRDYKIFYNTDVIRDYCLQEITSPISCNEKVQELSEKIDDRIASLEKIKAQKMANELTEAKIKKEDSSGERNTTIVSQPIYIFDRTPIPYKPPGDPFEERYKNKDRFLKPKKPKQPVVPRPR